MVVDAAENRYMFDTNALNRICRNSFDEIAIYQSKCQGWEYYFSEIQCQESSNTISKQTEGVLPQYVERERAERALSLLRVIPKLQTRYVALIATLRPRGWLLDGTYSILPDGEYQTYKLFTDILNNNDRQYYNDAMIGMTAIIHGCVVVTDDKRFFNKINKHFPERAIKYNDFLEKVTAFVGLSKTQSLI